MRIKPEFSFLVFSSKTQAIFLCSDYTRLLIMPTQKGILYSTCVNSNSTEPEQVVHTHRTPCWSRWPGGFCALNPSHHSRMFTSVSVGSILRSYLFTSATTVRIGVHSAPKYGTETIRYVTLLFRYWCGAASLRHRNQAEITVFVCEQKPYPVFAPAQKLSGTA